jgi:hypothetical protein
MAERLDQALAMNEALATRMTDLQRRLADLAPADGPRRGERRIDSPEGAERQTDRKHLRRLKASDEVINVGAVGVSTRSFSRSPSGSSGAGGMA